MGTAARFSLMLIAQRGKLQYQAVLLLESLRKNAPHLLENTWVCEPQPGPLWPDDPRIESAPRRAILKFGARIIPFESRMFGHSYPYGNKIEALAALPKGRPFLFLDSDTLILRDISALPFDFTRPAASMRRSDTWPRALPGGAPRAQIWQALYALFDLDFQSSVDPAYSPDAWQHYLYFNAGWFYDACPARFGALFAHIARTIHQTPPPELAGQSLDPWLDQIALPLTIHALGGGRPPAAIEAAMDGAAACHWRRLALLYARESESVVALLESIARNPELAPLLRHYRPLETMVYGGAGAQARRLFDRSALPQDERIIRRALRRAGLWVDEG